MSSPKPGHTTGGSRRGAGRGGGAGSGKIGYRQNNPPRRQGSPVPSKASRTYCLNVSSEARTNEILCKPNAGTKSAVDQRPITGSSAVYPRFIRGLSARREALFLSWLLNGGPTPVCLCEPSSREACLGMEAGYFVGEPICRRPVLLNPTLLGRPTPRRPDLICSRYVRVLFPDMPCMKMV